MYSSLELSEPQPKCIFHRETEERRARVMKILMGFNEKFSEERLVDKEGLTLAVDRPILV